jgi:hypothetical protein
MAIHSYAVIENEAAYNAAIKRNILANAQKTWRKNTERAEEIEAVLEDGRLYDHGRVSYAEGFMGSMAKAYDTFGKLTPAQSAAILKGIDARAARKAEWADKQAALNASRTHVGEIGQKLTLELTLKKVIEIEGMAFSRYDNGLTFIFIFEDAEQNVVIYKGRSSALMDLDEGSVVSLIATIKDHGVRNGVKQTIIQRPKKV